MPPQPCASAAPVRPGCAPAVRISLDAACAPRRTLRDVRSAIGNGEANGAPGAPVTDVVRCTTARPARRPLLVDSDIPTVRSDAHGMWPLPRARRRQTEADGAVHPHDHPAPFPRRAGPRRRHSSRPPPASSRPSAAGAAPGTAAEASELVQKAAEQLTAIDEQVHEAELIVAAQQQAAAAAAGQAAAAHARAGRLRAAAARHRPERLHRQDPVAGRGVPDQRVRRPSSSSR